MQKIDKIVLKETLYIAAWVIIFSFLMQAVFLITGWWSLPVLFGNILGGAAAVLNFLFMGITVQIAVSKEEKEAKQTMKTSATARNFFVFLVAVLGVVLEVFNTLAVLIPLFFPRFAIMLRPLFDKASDRKEKSDEN